MLNQNSEIQLGKITLLDKIGGGGFGDVYEARQEPLKNLIAIKIFNPSPFQNNHDTCLQRFFQEAEILMSLRHPHITPIYGFGEYEGKPYILMERFTGMNLYEAVNNRPRPNSKQVLSFIKNASSALGYAHEHKLGVVHRDIKPSNLLTIAGDMRVVDFGIAKAINPLGEDLTLKGDTLKGDAFAAPELTSNPKLVDPRCDVYSLGACWFWLLTGVPPHGRNVTQNIRRVENISPEYEQVLLKCLDEPDSRYHSMSQLESDVQQLITGDTPNATRDEQLDDSAALVLGVIFGKYTPEREAVSVWSLQRELAENLWEFEFSVSLKKLRSRGLVDDTEVYDINGNTSLSVKPTNSGSDWIDGNSRRISELLAAMRQPTSTQTGTFDQEIPF